MKGMIKSVSAFVALLFLFNLFTSMPMLMQFHDESDSVHFVASDLDPSSVTEKKDLHNNMEHCGMTSCSITLSNEQPVKAATFLQKTLFSFSKSELESLYRAPPSRPPSA
jgi:hypothetical protein